jgi:hypothetical protein
LKLAVFVVAALALALGALAGEHWAYARKFVLQDHMFEPNESWSLPAHLLTVSEWSAKCSLRGDPRSCVGAPNHPAEPPDFRGDFRHTVPSYAWTDLTYLLHKHRVSWRYYVFKGAQPDCANDAATTCVPVVQSAKTPGIWNPLPYFTTVREDRPLRDITSLQNFFKAAHAGTLPAVSWIVPNDRVSEHPPALVSAGQAYARFIEDDFLAGQRLDPRTDGRPDPRPDVRENAPVLGNLATDFDFTQKPRRPLIFALYPALAAKQLRPVSRNRW